jgi:hypothetical protein
MTAFRFTAAMKSLNFSNMPSFEDHFRISAKSTYLAFATRTA